MTSQRRADAAQRLSTRRQFVTGTALALGGVAVSSGDAWAGPAAAISHAEESIHQEIDFAAAPGRVYATLSVARLFAQVVQLSAAAKSGVPPDAAPTLISPRVGSTFSLFGGHIVGRHIELLTAQRIVQAWRVVDWPPGHYSIACFRLVPRRAGTQLILDHRGFPIGQADHLAAGWTDNYWEPMQRALA